MFDIFFQLVWRLKVVLENAENLEYHTEIIPVERLLSFLYVIDKNLPFMNKFYAPYYILPIVRGLCCKTGGIHKLLPLIDSRYSNALQQILSGSPLFGFFFLWTDLKYDKRSWLLSHMMQLKSFIPSRIYLMGLAAMGPNLAWNSGPQASHNFFQTHLWNGSFVR